MDKFSRLFINRGQRIRNTHEKLLLKYGLLLFCPFLLGLGLFHLLVTYPKVQQMNGKFEATAFLVPIVLTILLLVLGSFLSFWLIITSKRKGGFFLTEWKKQSVAKFLISNNLVEKKTINGKEKLIFPRVWYKKERYIDEWTFELGNRFHDRFLQISETLEEMFLADLVEVEREPMFIVFRFLTDTKMNRLTIEELSEKEGSMDLMKGVTWDYASLPHMLITGGTGGGKTYFIYSLIKGLGGIGRVWLADPKKSDLGSLAEFPAFKGLVAVEKEEIFTMLETAVELMDKRYKYMKEHEKHTVGVDYRYYGMHPEFFIIDEIGAFVSTLSIKEENQFYQLLAPLILKARQAGVFFIIATQKAGTDVLKSSIRDNLMCKVSLGVLSATGYDMTFGIESKKPFYNKPKEIGRGYINVGNGIEQEFYAPWAKGFNFVGLFQSMPAMPFTDVSEVSLSQEDKHEVSQEEIEKITQENKEKMNALKKEHEEEKIKEKAEKLKSAGVSFEERLNF